jgi:hypothetical protein
VSPVQSCKGCGGLFPFLPRGICADCIDAREEQFQAVREWLRDNRGATIAGACQATGVEERVIAEFIREGRIELSGPAPAALDTSEADAVRARIAQEMAGREAQRAPAPGTPAARRGMKTRIS